LIIPKNVKKIGQHAFADCDNLNITMEQTDASQIELGSLLDGDVKSVTWNESEVYHYYLQKCFIYRGTSLGSDFDVRDTDSIDYKNNSIYIERFGYMMSVSSDTIVFIGCLSPYDPIKYHLNQESVVFEESETRSHFKNAFFVGGQFIFVAEALEDTTKINCTYTFY